MIDQILAAKKVAVYVLGLLAQLLTLGVVPAPAVPYVAGLIAIATGLGIYSATNVPAVPGEHVA